MEKNKSKGRDIQKESELKGLKGLNGKTDLSELKNNQSTIEGSKESLIKGKTTHEDSFNSKVLCYGAIVSLCFDYFESGNLIKLTYDMQSEVKKDENFRKKCEDFYVKNKLDKNIVPRSNSNSPERSLGNTSVRNNSKVATKSRSNITLNEKKSKQKSKEYNYLTEKSFLYTKGVFSNECILHKFHDSTNIQSSYKNTLFRIIPAGEYESQSKLKNSLDEIVSDYNKDNKKEENDKELYSKFKQETLNNHENYMKIILNRGPVNFEDTVHFLHIQTGKFLQFHKKEDFQFSIKLSRSPSSETIFRILPGYSYQNEISTNIYYDMPIRIACRDKYSSNEIFISADEQSWKSQSNNFLNRDTEKNILLKADDKSFNRWKFFLYTADLEEADKWLNNFDMFWIQNCEKDVYIITSPEEEKNINKRKQENSLKMNEKSQTIVYGKSSNLNNSRHSSGKFPQRQSEEKFYEIKNMVTLKERDLKEEDFKRFPTIESHRDIDNLNTFNTLSNLFNGDQVNNLDKARLNLSVISVDMNDIYNPLGLFAFESVEMKREKDANNIHHAHYTNFIHSPPSIGPLEGFREFKIKNVFSNKIVVVDESDSLKLINPCDLQQEKDSWFLIEFAYDKKERKEKDCFIKKNEMVKIKSVKTDSYLAVKSFDDKNSLFLTKNQSDLTIFKLDFISYEDKLIVNFFDNLNNILNKFFNIYSKKSNFSSQNTQFTTNNEDSLETEEKENLSRLLKIFTKLKEILKDYKTKRINPSHEEQAKLNVLKNMKEFEIVEKLVKIILSIWFKLNFQDSTKPFPKIESNDYQSEFTQILKGNVNEKLDTKVKCTNMVLKILKYCFELDKTIILSIQNYLHYFFKFAGKLNSCTKFLISILRNNTALLMKLFSYNQDNSENTSNSKLEIKKIIKEIFYENLNSYANYDSLVLLFDLLNVMLICNDEPFKPFFNDIILDLKLLVKDFEDGFEVLKPNPNLSLLVEFSLVQDNRIFFKKRIAQEVYNEEANDYFEEEENSDSESEHEGKNINSKPKDSNGDKPIKKTKTINPQLAQIEMQINIPNLRKSGTMISGLRVSNTEQANEKILEKFNNNYNQSRPSNEYIYYDISFHDLRRSYSKIMTKNIKKLLAQILLFYSNLSLNDERFKRHLQKIFKIEIVNNYLSMQQEKYEFEEVKCALIRMINYLYLKLPQDKIETTSLCRKLSEEKSIVITSVHSFKFNSLSCKLSNEDQEKEMIKIINNVEEKIIKHLKGNNVMSTLFLQQIVESCQYILRNIYTTSNNFDQDRQFIFKFVALCIIILETQVDLIRNPDHRRSSNFTFETLSSEYNTANEKEHKRNDLLKILRNDKLSLDGLNFNFDDSDTKSISQNSPFLKFFDFTRQRFILLLDSVSKKKPKTVKPLPTYIENDPSLKRKKEFRDAANRNAKDDKIQLIKRICSIFNEFVKYIEMIYVKKVETNILELIKESEEDPRLINENKNDIINTKIFKFNTYNDDLDFMNYLDHFAIFHIGKKKELNLINNNERIFEDKLEPNKKYPKPKQAEFMTTRIFFECLHRLDDMALKVLIFKILYRMNSQKIILFEKISNLVIVSKEADIKNFDKLKSYFIKLNAEMKNISSTPFQDESMRIFVDSFNKNLENIVNILYDKVNMTLDCEDLEQYRKRQEKAEDYDDYVITNRNKRIKSVYSKSHHSKSKKDVNCLNNLNYLNNVNDGNIKNLENINNNLKNHIPNSSKKIGKTLLEFEPDKDININKLKTKLEVIQEEKDKFFLNDSSSQRLQFVQCILKNLNLHKILVKFLKKVNELIELRLNHGLSSNEIDIYDSTLDLIQNVLESLYNLLAIFIKRNNKHKFMLEEDIECILYPINLKKLLKRESAISISSFILEFLKDYSLSDLSNAEEFINYMEQLMNNFDWKKNMDLIPYWIEILKVLLNSPSREMNERLIVCLVTIKDTLIYELRDAGSNSNLNSNSNSYNTDIAPLCEVVRLYIHLKNINSEEIENKLNSLFKFSEVLLILRSLQCTDEDSIPFELINLTVELLFSSKQAYLLEINKRYNYEKFVEIFEDIASRFYSKEIPLYENDEGLEEDVYHLNIFVSVALPKLYLIYTLTSYQTNDKILHIVDTHYEKLCMKLDSFNEYHEKEYYVYQKSFLLYIKPGDIKDLGKCFETQLTRLNMIAETYFCGKFKHKHSTLNYYSAPSKKTVSSGKQAETSLWYVIRKILNNPGSINALTNNCYKDEKYKLFYEKIKFLVKKERETLILYVIDFIKYSEFKESFYTERKSTSKFDFQFIKLLNTVFTAHVDSSQSISKDHIYLYFWILVRFMHYNIQSNKFEKEPVDDNKDILCDVKYSKLIMKILRRKNLKVIDYSIALIIKFYTTYLKNLDDIKKIKFYEFLMNDPESENLFKIIKNVILNFKSKIEGQISIKSEETDDKNNDLKSKRSSKLLTVNNRGSIEESKSVNYDSTKYEDFISPYEEVVHMIFCLVENNSQAHVMKNYLRYQHNNTKSHNFIALLASVFDCFLESKSSFSKDSNKEREQINKLSVLNMNFATLIQTISSLTKCCEGPNLENQNSLISDSRITEFISTVLFKIKYREESDKFKSYQGEVSCQSIDLPLRDASFLKFNLILLLLSFLEGRKRNDKIFEKLLEHIGLRSLAIVLAETIQEIMIEKKFENIDQFILTDDLYNRFILQDSQKKDENFIIFEIGTFIYVLLNIFYDKLNNSKSDEFIIKITEMKKNLVAEKKVIKTSHILTNTFDFFIKLKKVLKSIWVHIFCCSRKKIENNTNKISILKEDDFLSKCFKLYFLYTPRVEVIFCGEVTPYFVKLSPMCKHLNSEMKEEFQNKVDRSNTKSKLNYLFKNIDYYQEALKYTEKIEEICKRYVIIDFFLNQYIFWKDLSFVITLAINFMIISSYFKKNVETRLYDYSFRYINLEYNITLTRNIIFCFSLTQFILSSLILINYMFKNLPKYTYISNTEVQDKGSCWKKIYNFIFRMVKDVILIYHIVHLILSVLGFFFEHYFLFAFHLLDISWRSATLTNLLLALWNPRKQLAVTLLLFLIFEYYFTIIIYIWLSDDLPDDSCNRFDRCLFTIYDQTFKNSNGMINYLSEKKYSSQFFLGWRFWFDNLFSIVLIIFILQMISGIIIDNFSALRENQQMIHDDKFNVCYICSLHKNELNKLYGNEDGYDEHTKLDHYYWNYMFLIMNLVKKNKKNLSGLDSHIYSNYNKQNYCWIPNGV